MTGPAAAWRQMVSFVMYCTTLQRFTCFAMLLSAAFPVSAHHSFAAEFDSSRPIVLRGKVTKIAWMNPHVHIWVDVSDNAGNATNWELESAAPNYLQSLGWTKQSLKPGDIVAIRAYPAKDQPHLAKTDVVTFPDCRRITTGHADDRAPDPDHK